MGQNVSQKGSTWAKKTPLSTPSGPVSLLEKYFFDPFWDYFLTKKGPFSKHVEIFRGPNV